jgi:Alkyl sulfatase dimerisation
VISEKPHDGHKLGIHRLRRVGLPVEVGEDVDSLAADWSTRGYYGTLSHSAKAVYQKYLGWYDGNPADLSSLPRVESARKTIAYSYHWDEPVVVRIAGADFLPMHLIFEDEDAKALAANRALIIPGRLNKIMRAVVPASLTRSMLAQMFEKMPSLIKPSWLVSMMMCVLGATAARRWRSHGAGRNKRQSYQLKEIPNDLLGQADATRTWTILDAMADSPTGAMFDRYNSRVAGLKARIESLELAILTKRPDLRSVHSSGWK